MQSEDFKPNLEPDTDTTLAEGKPKQTRGRPRREVNVEQLIKLAEYGCSTDEMGDFFGVAGSTIRRNYQDVIKHVKSNMRSRLRKAQMELALGGNVTMLIWLGKQHLGQSDSGERSSDEDQILPWED